MNRFNLLFLVAFLFFASGCSRENTDPDPTPSFPGELTITGKIEKGPFASGSSVSFHLLDQLLSPSGTAFASKTLSDDGSYTLESTHFTSPYVTVLGVGYYYDEIQALVPRVNTLSLSAVADLTESTTVHVNVLTHLKKDRIVYLVGKEGKTFREASEQAQKELLANFGLQRYATKEASRVSLWDGTEAGAALLVVSATLLNWCGSNATKLTQQMTYLATELKEKGEFSQETRKELRQASLTIDWDKVTANMIAKYASLDSKISLPDLSQFIDWDGDGVAGNEN